MAAEVIVLGSQHATPDVGAVVRERGLRGPIAIVRAGYQEREADDGPLVAALGVPAINLALHARASAVFADDPSFTTAYRDRQALLRHMQSCYRVRLEKTEDAAIARRQTKMVGQSIVSITRADGSQVEGPIGDGIMSQLRTTMGESEFLRLRQALDALEDDGGDDVDPTFSPGHSGDSLS